MTHETRETLNAMERYIAQKGLGWLLTSEDGFEFIRHYLILKSYDY